MNTRSTLRNLAHYALAATLAVSTGMATAQRDNNNRDDHHQGDNQDQHNDQDQRNDHQHGNDQQWGNRQQQNRSDFHFQDQHRSTFQQHYSADANRWRNNSNRPHFEAGQSIPRNYAIRPVPQSYYRGVPPPSGYRYGYYDGYVVAYNPTSRIIADVLDLATGR